MITNADLYAGYAALVEASKAKIASADVRFRLALARNHLRPIAEALDEQRAALVAKHTCGAAQQAEATSGDPPRLSAPFLRRLEAFNAEWKALCAKEGPPWKAPQSIVVARLGDKDGVTAEQVAALLLIGVLTEAPGEPALEATDEDE